ncbi:MAG: FecCD family ABC transporter permease, partial [Myxococcota bacterium]
ALSVGPDGISLEWLTSNRDALTISLRVSRVMLALLVGAALSLAGASLQTVLRNPLADPYVIGVSGGAALGGSLVVAFSTSLGHAAVSTGAVLGALFASGPLVWFLERDGAASPHEALLAGVVFNAFAAALITLIKTMLPPERGYALLFWLVGSVGYPDGTALAMVGLCVVVGASVLLLGSGRLELLSLGHDEAARLGVNPRHTLRLTYLAASILVGAVIPLTGMIGFVGLVVPHLLRAWVCGDVRLLLPASGLFGAAVLVVFDAAARGAFAILGTELPVGALTALVGGPLFAFTLRRRSRGPL